MDALTEAVLNASLQEKSAVDQASLHEHFASLPNKNTDHIKTPKQPFLVASIVAEAKKERTTDQYNEMCLLDMEFAIQRDELHTLQHQLQSASLSPDATFKLQQIKNWLISTLQTVYEVDTQCDPACVSLRDAMIESVSGTLQEVQELLLEINGGLLRKDPSAATYDTSEFYVYNSSPLINH